MDIFEEELLKSYQYYMEFLSKKVFYFCLDHIDVNFLEENNEKINEKLDLCVKGYGEIYNISIRSWDESMAVNLENIVDLKDYDL